MGKNEGTSVGKQVNKFGCEAYQYHLATLENAVNYIAYSQVQCKRKNFQVVLNTEKNMNYSVEKILFVNFTQENKKTNQLALEL